MERNEGSIDRLVRIVAGLGLLSVVLFGGPHSWIGWFGLIPLTTGLVGTCPIYRLLHIQTCSSHGKAASR